MAVPSLKAEILRQYDELHYPSLAHRQTAPERLATIARLHGIVTPSLDRCRVLELGCAVGGNLAAMAMSMPNAKFVGVDINEKQIEHGKNGLAAAGVTNVELCALDLMEVGASFGTFDYIIAHGVFSWISRDAQDSLLAVFERCLAPHGVAYVSYNVKPGWHVLSVARDGMAFDARDEPTPRGKIRRAREYLAWVLETIPADGGRFGPRFVEEVGLMQALDDESLLHEYLGPYHLPIHFNKLVARATRYGLEYLCDGEPAHTADHSMSPEGERARERSPSELIFAEQYYDFLANQRFRRSLFCRRGAPLTRAIDRMLVDDMFVSSRGLPVSDDRGGAAPLTFRTAETDLTTGHPAMKAAMLHLAAIAPRAIGFRELVDTVRARLGVTFDVDALRHDVLQAFLSSVGVVTLRPRATPCVREPGERPITTPWVRHLATVAAKVPNLDLEMVHIDPVVQKMLPLLDGTRDRAAIEAVLREQVDRGELLITMPDGRRGVPASSGIHRALEGLARSGLIIA
jgi:methyltransferase-like protein/SAM-dependent methyltransferase